MNSNQVPEHTRKYVLQLHIARDEPRLEMGERQRRLVTIEPLGTLRLAAAAHGTGGDRWLQIEKGLSGFINGVLYSVTRS